MLILGPTGSGKEVVARTIHELSARRSGRLQAVNCAALPDTLFESEMFGYERGAFTGAAGRKAGPRRAGRTAGTLFLDEIGDLPLLSQVKLLRVVEERRIERLGGGVVARRRLPADLRHAPAARSAGARAAVSRGPLLPHQRLDHPAAVAARAAGGHSGAGRTVPRRVLHAITGCREPRRRLRRMRSIA